MGKGFMVSEGEEEGEGECGTTGSDEGTSSISLLCMLRWRRSRAGGRAGGSVGIGVDDECFFAQNESWGKQVNGGGSSELNRSIAYVL